MADCEEEQLDCKPINAKQNQKSNPVRNKTQTAAQKNILIKNEKSNTTTCQACST